MNQFMPQYAPQPYQQRFFTPQQPISNGITWVQGIEGAKAFQMMPNSNAVLMDSENDGTMYIKVSDNVGMCTLRTFRFSEVFQDKKISEETVTEYVTRDELARAIDELKGEIRNGKQTVPTAKSASKRQAESDE